MHPHNKSIRSDDCNLSPLFLSVLLVRKCLDVYSSHIRVLQWKCCQRKLLFSSFAKTSCLFNVKFYSVLNIKISRTLAGALILQFHLYFMTIKIDFTSCFVSSALIQANEVYQLFKAHKHCSHSNESRQEKAQKF